MLKMLAFSRIKNRRISNSCKILSIHMTVLYQRQLKVMLIVHGA